MANNARYGLRRKYAEGVSYASARISVAYYSSMTNLPAVDEIRRCAHRHGRRASPCLWTAFLPRIALTRTFGANFAIRSLHALDLRFTLYAADHAPARFQPVHDARVVWPSALQTRAAHRRNRGELAHCIRGILRGGAGEPLGQRRLYDRATQDHSVGDHASRLRRLLDR